MSNMKIKASTQFQLHHRVLKGVNPTLWLFLFYRLIKIFIIVPILLPFQSGSVTFRCDLLFDAHETHQNSKCIYCIGKN